MKEFDVLATLYVNKIEDGSLLEKVEDVFTIEDEPTENVIDDYAEDFFAYLKKQCKLNLEAIDCDKFYRLDVVVLSNDYPQDDEEDKED